MRTRRFDAWLAAAGVAMVGIGACGRATAPSSPPSLDAAQRYRLNTHCGVLSVTVAGRTFSPRRHCPTAGATRPPGGGIPAMTAP